MSEIKVLLVNDHQILRDGLKKLFESRDRVRVVAAAASAEEALSEMEGRTLDVVVSDLALPGMGGLWLIEQVKSTRPTLPVLVLSRSDDSQDVMDALRYGAAGYLTKTVDVDELATAIHCVCRGECYLQSRLSSTMVKAIQSERDRAGPTLGERERALLQSLYEGLSNKALSDKHCVSLSTIKAQLRGLFRKFNVSSRTELVVAALKAGLIKED